MSKLLFYDVETTGTDHKAHAIHQISGIIVIDGEKKTEFDFKVAPHPTAVIDEEALKVSNVTKDQIMAYEANIMIHKKLLATLGRFCNKFNKLDKYHLVGYNNKGFDNDFFRTFFNHCGDTYYGSWFWADSIDVLVLASDYLQEERAKLTNFQLRTVAAYLGIPVDETKLHDAQYDIWLTWEIYKIVSHKRMTEKEGEVIVSAYTDLNTEYEKLIAESREMNRQLNEEIDRLRLMVGVTPLTKNDLELPLHE